jgi:uncharacterized protein (TIGR03435 family)
MIGFIRRRMIGMGAALAIPALAMAQSFAPRGSQVFEVASVKPSPPNTRGTGVRPAPGGRRYVGSGIPLRSYLYVAYQVRPEQIAGGPNWLDNELYDLNAEADQPTSIENLHIMLQNILTDRFKLQFHFEKKEMRAYVLTVDKNGPKNLTAHPNPSAGEVFLDQSFGPGLNNWHAHCASMDFFTWRLSQTLPDPIINQTGLEGCFDFDLNFVREQFPVTPVMPTIEAVLGPSIYDALKNQLGLKLESKKAPVEVMVIDHAERPTAN